MTVIYYYNYCGDLGEVEGIFDEHGILIDSWWSNDANWRNEYFSGFLAKLGIWCDRLPAELKANAIKQLENAHSY